MNIGLENQLVFKATGSNFLQTNLVAQAKDKIDVPNGNIGAQAPDSLELNRKPKTVKDSVAGVWKFFAKTNQMVSSTIKGLIYAGLTGFALVSGSWLFKALPNAFTKEGPTLLNTIEHPLKSIGKSGKIIAGIGSGLVLAYHVVAGKLEANQKTAVIDHKMKTGHRDK